MSAPDRRAALMRLLITPEALTDADLTALALLDGRWRDRALERRAAAKQAAAAPPAKTGAAALVRIADFMIDAADLIADLTIRERALAEEVETLRLELAATQAAQEVVRD